jgi:hypothetical protein
MPRRLSNAREFIEPRKLLLFFLFGFIYIRTRRQKMLLPPSVLPDSVGRSAILSYIHCHS